jgi:thymidylate synthase (FAD)
MQVRLIGKTTGLLEYEGKSIDEIITGIARVSSGRDTNDLFTDADKLLRHCIVNGHWSIFEMANLTFEIKTSRAIGREILRHGKSLNFQEFSQRYQVNSSFEPIELRKQSKSNRQSSEDILTDFDDLVNEHIIKSESLYIELLKNNVAKETARFILPETTSTTLVCNGSIRSWITTLNQRLHKTAQKEARLIAEAIRDILIQEVPVICKALNNFENAYEVHIMDWLVLNKYGKL